MMNLGPIRINCFARETFPRTVLLFYVNTSEVIWPPTLKEAFHG